MSAAPTDRIAASQSAALPLDSAPEAGGLWETTRHRPPLDQIRSDRRRTFERFWFALGRALSTFHRFVDLVVGSAAIALGVVVTASIFALASPSLLLGVERRVLWSKLSRGSAPVFNTLGGVVSGIVQWPLTGAGMALALIRNVASLRWARCSKSAVETLLQPIFAALLTGSQPLLFGFKELSDSLAKGRALTGEEKAAFAYDFDDDLLDSARFFEEPTLLHRVMGWVGGVGAFTVGDDIYAFYPLGPTTERHELIHSTQYRESMGGRLGFLADYWSDLLSNALTMDLFSAYRNTRAEREAYELENDPGHSR